MRGYEAGDFERMFALDELCFAKEFRFSRSSMRRFAEAKRARVVIAEEGGEIAGFCIVHIETLAQGCAGYVVTLDVAPEFRRCGLARRMMRSMEETMQGEGCSSMLLHVFVENADAIRFYESIGWERGHTADAFYGAGLDAVVYRKRIGDGFSEAS
jgi:ribosomal-protein-alanine N-acetyltransferase